MEGNYSGRTEAFRICYTNVITQVWTLEGCRYRTQELAQTI